MLDTAQLYQVYQRHPAVFTDTRQVVPGGLFFALKGANFDGNAFAAPALAAGAAHAVVDDPALATTTGCLLVTNVLTALQDLARYHRRQLAIPFLAITGTNGKTTTKELVAAVLAQKFATVATRGNLNNHIGVPLTLLGLTAATQMAVVEMGANHVGDIAELCAIAEPNFGLITNIGQAHLEGFGSYEGVVKAKNELYEHLLSHQGTALVNGRYELLARLADKLPGAVYYGTPSSFYFAELVATDPYIRYRDDAGQQHTTQLLGAYNFDNVLTALAVGRYFGVPDEAAHAAVRAYAPTNNRSQVVRGASNTIIADAYNANPSSMEAALESFARLPAARKVAILGDMRELGTYAPERHLAVLDHLDRLHLAQVYVCGPEFAAARLPRHQAQAFLTKDELADSLAAHPVRDSHVLLKGSRGIGLETLLPLLQA
ncbi:MAG: UDP-N-acetylmuramoyl-tripeptide--D-alanyl-D-alanine ligase [Bernardetiaceae bacterium]|jgi:UDP-N-acetylmuramoyl-tripeptide--D-alanyl-D-alanine ligase|nr:UDP-N-acetylmuramoyl-tripeptide--D-alanyl-D-alanine ligase [Bernardetiaceae bacterium]